MKHISTRISLLKKCKKICDSYKLIETFVFFKTELKKNAFHLPGKY